MGVVRWVIDIVILNIQKTKGKEMKKIVLTVVALLAVTPTVQAETKAENLFATKCMACHSTTRPTDMSKVVAPALMGVMRHIKMEYPNKTEAVAFMKDYVLNPSKEKAICMPRKIERFGLMPSQKGNITSQELDIILPWMFDNFPPKGFRGNRNNQKMDR